MKKLFTGSLVFALIFMLAAMTACGGDPSPQSAPSAQKTDQPQQQSPAEPVPASKQTPGAAAETEAEKLARLKASLPNQYVPEKLEAGIDVTIAHANAQLDDQFAVLISNGIKGWCEEQGIIYAVSNANSDIGLQMQQIENFAVMGCAAIGSLVQNEDAYADMAAACEKLGTYFCLLNTPKIRVSGAANVDSPAMGQACSKMAIAWLDIQYPDAEPGEVHAMLLDNSRNPNNIARMDAMKETIGKDDRVDIVYIKDEVTTLDGGFTAAQEALTYDPTIKLALCFTVTQATGINNYIISQPGVVLEEYGIFCTGYDGNTAQLVEAAGSGGDSALRGTIAQGGDNPGQGMCKLFEALLFDGEQPQVDVWEPLWSMNAIGFEFEMYSNWRAK